jgi:hypothetical protein
MSTSAARPRRAPPSICHPTLARYLCRYRDMPTLPSPDCSRSAPANRHSVLWQLAIFAFVLGVAFGSPACSTSTLPAAAPCLPEPLQVNPAEIVAGSSVTVSSAPFKCHGSYHPGATYQLTLGLIGRSAPIDLGSYPVNTDGSFRALVKIPATASPGDAGIIVHGSPFDQCDAIGQSTSAPALAGVGGARRANDRVTLSCAGYTVPLTILPANT